VFRRQAGFTSSRPSPPPPASIPIIGDPEVTGVKSKKRKRIGADKLQIPLTNADIPSGLCV